jgi:hypothetical protein
VHSDGNAVVLYGVSDLVVVSATVSRSSRRSTRRPTEDTDRVAATRICAKCRERVYLYDDQCAHVRAVCADASRGEMRAGALLVRERWEHALGDAWPVT